MLSPHLMLRPRMAAKRKCSGTKKKMPSLLVVVAVAMLMLQYNRTLFLPQVNSEKVNLIMHGMQDDFPFYH